MGGLPQGRFSGMILSKVTFGYLYNMRVSFEYASCFACILLMMAIGKSSDSLMAVFLIMLLLVAPRILRIGKSSQRQLRSL